MEALIGLILVVLILQFIFVLWNQRYLCSLQELADQGRKSKVTKVSRDEERPLISILIPARNEAHNIDACIESIVNNCNTSMNVEVLVLDDNSTDGTGEKVKAWSHQNHSIRLIQGKEKPEDWLGKSYACHQLAQEARGSWWLFFDADTRLKPGGLARTLQVAESQGQGLITGIPYQITGTWMEKIVLPMMMFTLLCHLPLRWVSASPNPLFSAAHGAFLFVHRQTYQAFGGHEAFKEHLLDDMEMARAVKRVGHKLTLAAIHDDVEMRMYQNGTEVWNGFKKNTFAGIGRNIFLLLLITLYYTFLYLVPPVFFFFSLLLTGTFWPLALLAWLMGLLLKVVIDRKSRQPIWLSLFLPLSILIIILIGWDSTRSAYWGSGYIWKGRSYS
ncbi:glycosyltransferase [Heliorestis acidaminivorans]|uniref:4,4'-diaponeurosporenoate glycosyltransferase n=1 Tax=Heliorestis acidaminivorans TaxID=553427 RepID=A0A6I0F0K1_9FIRM|nr:glycosyltransferase family 2 protein [Heliorestis acidaminivorans]KAB2953406.1 glycosyltransferase [Heliorestis acidaminivorans]